VAGGRLAGGGLVGRGGVAGRGDGEAHGRPKVAQEGAGRKEIGTSHRLRIGTYGPTGLSKTWSGPIGSGPGMDLQPLRAGSLVPRATA